MELFFEVKNQKMERIDIENPVNSSQEYLKLSFDFKTEDWEDTTKFIFFRVHHINYSYPLTDDSIIVPSVFVNGKHLDFGVYGVGGEDYRITTNSLRIKFRESEFWSLSDAPLSITELIEKLFDEKADLTYVDEQLDLKADLVYVDTELADKVDKVDGKELSSNDFTDEYLNLIETHQENINDLSVNKVDKVAGKELSSNDFTNTYKSKLDNLDNDLDKKADKIDTYTKTEVDTRVNVKADKTYVDNKLSDKVDKVTGKGLSTNDFTNYYKNFLDGFDGDIEAFLLEHKEEIEALITADVLAAKADKSYVDTELDKKSDIAYVDSELSKKANIVHTHTESDIADLQDYALSNEVYLKSEVDELLHNLNNKFVVNSTNDVIQVGDTTEIYAHTLKNGMPCIQRKIHFFEKLEPSINLSASQSILQLDDDMELYARVKDSDGSLVQNTKVHFYRSIFADVYDKGEGNYYFNSNYLTQTVTEDGVLITDNHPDTASEGPWYRVSLPFNVLPPEETDWSNLCVFSTNNDYCIELDIIDSTDTSQTIDLRPYSQGAELHKQTLSELSNNASFHLKIEVINGVSYWYVDNNPTPVYMEDSIDLGDAFAFRLALHKQQSMKFDNLIIYKIK